MARKKQVSELSAEQLYEMARQREREEQEAERETMRAQLEEARERRRELLAEHKRELAAIDREIRQLGGRGRRSRGGQGGGGKISDRVLALLGSAGRMTTKDLKATLEEEGIDAKNLNQLLAYLKRNGRVVSPQRSVYALAK